MENSKMALQRTLTATFSITSIIWIWLLIAARVPTARAKIGYFWHITDLHFDPAYSTKGDVLRSCWYSEHHQGSSRSVPGRFGDYNCDSPWSLLESATQAMRSRQGDNVEFVLWTGDGLSHSTRRSLESHRLDLLRNITELLGRTFPSQFVFPVLGHEDGQSGNFRRLGELWRHWLPLEALQTFEKGGYYTIEQTKSRLRIIVLNTNFMRQEHTKLTPSHSAAIRQRPSNPTDSSEHTNYYYHHRNYYHGSNNGYYSAVPAMDTGGQTRALSAAESHESQRQWEWLEAVLAKSQANKETVYIVGHMPPGLDERQVGNARNGHSTFSENNNSRYIKLVRAYSSIIQGQFFGHLHSDSFRIVYNLNGDPVSWIMIAPSVTPRKMNVGANNPGMRLYKFETDTGQVLDYTQYYLDLDQANSVSEPVWQAEYNLTTQYYGLAEVTAVALHNLAERFSNADDPLLANAWILEPVVLRPVEHRSLIDHFWCSCCPCCWYSSSPVCKAFSVPCSIPVPPTAADRPIRGRGRPSSA
ncbi:acid sphingomyelinase-like phosphodiesterase 3b isoform X2 [Phlebotomus papatasi]|uniref:acid sphingomyelinase-like phosphodiesterase 3b isoform X2 n=1 Tax=Phlebotomus papatasi TaxID=29031 RepID=UPI0024836689|nr:acid sphingomyelinase-like phosphodiesterase 3b isoform X2 [Phlebotomus papatasi]